MPITHTNAQGKTYYLANPTEDEAELVLRLWRSDVRAIQDQYKRQA